MKKTLMAVALGAVLAGPLAAFETTKTLDLTAQGIKRLDIDAGAGSLTVTGREGLAAIEIRAEVVARNVREEDMERFIRDRIELTLEKRGEVAVLVSRARDEKRLFHFDGNVHIDLTVSVPKAMAVSIDDGSGSIIVEGLSAALRLEDGSGSIRIDRIAGDVEINDGSGEIEVLDVTGNVTIDDGSGEITIRRVGGTVTIDDGSGRIDIEGVEKDVRLISAGSGSVDVSEVKGRLIRSR
jgi:DUF4097 and DUF4098 domain-containing protein YvlB